MPKFKCQVCETSFEVPQAALEKYPGWTPRYCREHSPTRRQAASGRPSSKRPKRARSSRRSVREEGLTLAQVLEKYDGGPATGVFTDGSASPNPGPGGWGVVWVEDGEVRHSDHGHEAQTTNNRMELTALIAAYRHLPEDAAVPVYTDSRLCVDTITKWAPGWERNGWRRKGAPLKNLDLVKELLRLTRARPKAPLEWIAAHSGYRWNEYADSLATAWMREEL